DGIRDRNVTGVQTCALPIFERGKDGAGRGGGVHLVALALEKEFEGLEDVLLVVSDEDAGSRGRGGHRSKVSGVGGQGPGACVDAAALTRPLRPRCATKIRSRSAGPQRARRSIREAVGVS